MWVFVPLLRLEANFLCKSLSVYTLQYKLRLCISVISTLALSRDSLVAQTVKNVPAMWKTQVWSLGWEDPMEEEMITHSNILAWRNTWMEEPSELQSMRLQRVRHDWGTSFFASVWDECNCEVVWTFSDIAFLWDWNENWLFPVLWPLQRFPNLLAYWVQHVNSITFYDLK